MKPRDIKSDFYAEHSVESNIKDPNIKVRDYETISKYTFLLKDMLLIGNKKFLWSAKLKTHFHGHMLFMI